MAAKAAAEEEDAGKLQLGPGASATAAAAVAQGCN
jgi:hypothetical protein